MDNKRAVVRADARPDLVIKEMAHGQVCHLAITTSNPDLRASRIDMSSCFAAAVDRVYATAGRGVVPQTTSIVVKELHEPLAWTMIN